MEESSKNKFLIVGLGNIGKEYRRTRHNVGFMFIDYLINQLNLEEPKLESKFEAEISQNKVNNITLVLAKPTTYMNNSGVAIEKISNYFKIEASNIIIVHDDLDIKFGENKIHLKTPRGHNGILSIEKHIPNHNEILKIRIGIENREGDQTRISPKDYVLSTFESEEQNTLENTVFPQIFTEINKIIFDKE